ncbi:hypothetical protein QZH41_001813 [Actinostola sp. cb2023]|nr:hypothetical protein QZH41_001813 [Actinostola sp. cb2023]
MWNESLSNSTHGGQQHYTNPALDGSLIVLSVFILVINGIVMYLFFSREYLQTKTNSLLVSLSVSDLTVGLLGIPLYIACNWERDHQICFASAATYRLQAVSEMAHIFMTTLERYIYVMYPMKYIRIVTAPRILKLMGGVWCFSLFVTFIQVAWNDPNDFFYNLNENPTRRLCAIVYNCFGIVVCFLIPLIIMVISYSRMFDVIHRQIKEIHQQNYPRDTTGSSRRTPVATEARAVSIFALMLSIFTLAWSSWYIIGVGVYFVQFYKAFPGPLMEFLHFFRFAVAFINPILYTFLKRDFARALKSLFNREGLRREFVTATHIRSRGFASNSMQTRISNSYGDDNPITANGNAT